MRPALALLHGYDKQSVGELVGSTVETSRCGPGENRSLAEGAGSNCWQTSFSHKERCAEEEGQTQRGGQSQDFSGDESPVEKVQGPEGQEVNHRPLPGDLRAAPAGSLFPAPEPDRRFNANDPAPTSSHDDGASSGRVPRQRRRADELPNVPAPRPNARARPSNLPARRVQGRARQERPPPAAGAALP